MLLSRLLAPALNVPQVVRPTVDTFPQLHGLTYNEHKDPKELFALSSTHCNRTFFL